MINTEAYNEANYEDECFEASATAENDCMAK